MADRNNASVFDGRGGLTSGQFVRIVRQNAVDKDKVADDQWNACYAAARMDGPALVWLEEQPEEVQESWKLLRQALLNRWPPSDVQQDLISTVLATSSGGVNIPTPAAAALPPIAPAPLDAVITGTGQLNTGRIRVVNFQGETLGYLSKSLDQDGDCTLTRNIQHAQVTNFTGSHKPHKIYLQDDLSNTRSSVLGWTLGKDKGVERGSLAHLTLPRRMSETVTSSSRGQGGSHIIRWCVLRNNQMVPFKEENQGGLQYLDVGVSTEDGYFVATLDLKKLKNDTRWSGQEVIFQFEAID